MSQHSQAEAGRRIAELVDEALAGGEVVITRDGQPVVRLVPLRRAGRRVPGRLKGQIWMAEDFDTWPPDVAAPHGPAEPDLDHGVER